MNANLIALAIAVLLSGCATTIGEMIGKYGYTELQPPSTLIPPGTIVEVESEQPVSVNIVCTQQASLGRGFEVPATGTTNRSLVEAVSKEFKIDANYLNAIRADAKFSSVKNIRLTIKNAKVAQLSGDAVFANVVNRRHECQQAIDAFLKRNRKITMITSVLVADAAFSVEFDDTVAANASIKADILKGLAPTLGASYSSSGTEEITGIALYWGVKDDELYVLLRNDRTFQPTSVTSTLQKFSLDALTDKTRASQAIIPSSAVNAIYTIK